MTYYHLQTNSKSEIKEIVSWSLHSIIFDPVFNRMLIKQNERLATYTSFRIGGITSKMYIPESEHELIRLIREFNSKQQDFYLLGNGTNLLVTDSRLSRAVISNRKACRFIRYEGDDMVRAGSSISLKSFVKKLIDCNLQSPVELATIPGSIGGAIFQNAGRGRLGNSLTISDNLISVEYFDLSTNEVSEIARDDCEFGGRTSIFQKHREWTILSATFSFPKGDPEINKQCLRTSLQAVSHLSYMHHPSAGSVFKVSSPRLMKVLRGLKFGEAQFSKDTPNTILNVGNARFRDVLFLICLGKFIHRICLKPAYLEIEIWR